MTLEPTKTEQYEQSYDGMKWTTQIVTNKNPRKLISFFASMVKLTIVGTKQNLT